MPDDSPFDMVLAGFVGDMEPAKAEALLAGYAEAGVTWWLEGFWRTDTVEDVERRISQGPPRLM